MKGHRIPFLAKYSETVGAGNVIAVRDFMIDIIQAGLRKSPSNATLDTVKEGITQWIQENQYELEGKMVEILSVCVFARREELRRILTELIF